MKSRKLLSVLLATILLLTCIPMGAISVSAFDYENGYYYVVTNGRATIDRYEGAISGDVVIPSILGGYPVTTIGTGLEVYPYGSKITSIYIPYGVTTINACAFYIPTMRWVYIPKTVKHIGNFAFNGCDKLEYVYYGGSEAEYQSLIRSSEVPSDPLFDAFVQYNSYYDRETGLFYAVNSGKATITGWNAGTSSELAIPSDVGGYPVAVIGQRAFDGYATLTKITIPTGVTAIENMAFRNCTALAEITIPEGVTTIDYSAFEGCSKLTSVTIPDSVTSIGYRAFSHCDSLTSINVDQNSTKYCSVDGVLFNKDKTTLIQYPASKTFTAYSIPDSVTSIGIYAFYDCTSLTSVTIPDSVTSIGGGAFYNCTSLTDVYYGGSENDKANITINSNNDSLFNATWHYADDPISDDVAHSVMDTTNGNGLAFRFELSAKGVVKNNRNVMDLANATIDYLGTDCKLIAMGAIVTNDDTAAENLTADAVNDYDVVNVPTVYLQQTDEDSCAFASRVIDIPDTFLERIIYARPYFIVEVDGEQITVYGEVDSASCAEYL